MFHGYRYYKIVAKYVSSWNTTFSWQSICTRFQRVRVRIFSRRIKMSSYAWFSRLLIQSWPRVYFFFHFESDFLNCIIHISSINENFSWIFIINFATYFRLRNLEKITNSKMLSRDNKISIKISRFNSFSVCISYKKYFNKILSKGYSRLYILEQSFNTSSNEERILIAILDILEVICIQMEEVGNLFSAKNALEKHMNFVTLIKDKYFIIYKMIVILKILRFAIYCYQCV